MLFADFEITADTHLPILREVCVWDETGVTPVLNVVKGNQLAAAERKKLVQKLSVLYTTNIVVCCAASHDKATLQTLFQHYLNTDFMPKELLDVQDMYRQKTNGDKGHNMGLKAFCKLYQITSPKRLHTAYADAWCVREVHRRLTQSNELGL